MVQQPNFHQKNRRKAKAARLEKADQKVQDLLILTAQDHLTLKAKAVLIMVIH